MKLGRQESLKEFAATRDCDQVLACYLSDSLSLLLYQRKVIYQNRFL